MSDAELEKIAANAAKHILPEGHLDKIVEAAKRHGKPFKAQQKIEREKPPSEALVKLKKQSKADIFLFGERKEFEPMDKLKMTVMDWVRQAD